MKPLEALDGLVNRQMLFRRLALIWAVWLVTVVVLRVTEPDTLLHITAAGATVVGSVVGILATVIGFYQHHRSKPDA